MLLVGGEARTTATLLLDFTSRGGWVNEPVTGWATHYTGSDCAMITLSLDALHVLPQQIRVEALGQAQQSSGPPRMMPNFLNIATKKKHVYLYY
jgi:hypothetical protein